MSGIMDLHFTDLFLGPEYYLKGASGRDTISQVPTGHKEELRSVHEELQNKAEKDFLYRYGGEFFRVARMETVEGTWYVLRRGYRQVYTLKDLQYPEIVRKLLCDSEKFPSGLIIFSGRTGSGKTTSASGFIRERLEVQGGHAVTLEDPPELPLHGEHGEGVCFQRELHHLEFGQGIVDAMRYGSPDIIMLGELREPHATSEALRAAINGHLIVSTIHTPGVQATVQRLMTLAQSREVNGASTLLAEGISGIIHQRLYYTGRLSLEVMFVTESDKGIRSKIREGKVHQLSTDIQQQQNRLFLEV